MTEEKLTDAIREHLAASPEREKVFAEIRFEWDQLKDKLLWMILGFLGSILAIGVWVGTIQTNFGHIQDEVDKQGKQYAQLEIRTGTQEITSAEIKTKLISIEATLQEIKIAVKAK